MNTQISKVIDYFIRLYISTKSDIEIYRACKNDRLLLNINNLLSQFRLSNVIGWFELIQSHQSPSFSSPAIILANVDFPLPELPVIAILSPISSSRFVRKDFSAIEIFTNICTCYRRNFFVYNRVRFNLPCLKYFTYFNYCAALLSI